MQSIDTDRLHGDERELTVMARDRYGRPVAPSLLVCEMMRELRTEPSIASSKEVNGLFVTHGHIYAELNQLLEAASAECRTPCEAVRQGALLRSLIATAAKRVRERLSLTEFVISQHNTAYSLAEIDQSTAGHFNISRFIPLAAMMPDLGTFMCVLPLLSGGGGIDMHAYEFTISIRAERCRLLTSGKTQSQRGLVDIKDITMPCGSRQQLLGIDNLQSHVQTRAVYTAIHLFFCCIEADLEYAPHLELFEPIGDMRKVILGPDLGQLMRLRNGRRMSAVQLLLTYMEWIRSRVCDIQAPEWAEAELNRAFEIVAKLDDGGISALEGLCDYATLFKLWNITLAAHDLTSEDARKAAQLLRRCGNPTLVWPALAQRDVVSPFSRLRPKFKDLTERYSAALQEFMVIAYEFGDIMRGGLFDQMKQAGIVAPGVLFCDEDLSAAINTPPPPEEGKCHIRAKVIFELQNDRIPARANWDEVNSASRGTLKLSQPTDFSWTHIASSRQSGRGDNHSFVALREYALARSTRDSSANQNLMPASTDQNR